MAREKPIKDGRDVRKCLDRHGIESRNCNGSHRVAKLPNGQVLTYHEHGEYGPGIRTKITKALMAAGLIGIIVAAYYYGLI